VIGAERYKFLAFVHLTFVIQRQILDSRLAEWIPCAKWSPDAGPVFQKLA
jgi:hypothetical protein